MYPADSASGECSKCVSVEMLPLFKQSRYNEWNGEVEREMTLELGERAGGCLTQQSCCWLITCDNTFSLPTIPHFEQIQGQTFFW